MNRGIVSESLNQLFDRLACAQVADEDQLVTVNDNLKKYIDALEETFEAIDKYTLEDLAKIFAYHHFNRAHILNAGYLDTLFKETERIIHMHCGYLDNSHITPDYLIGWGICKNVY